MVPWHTVLYHLLLRCDRKRKHSLRLMRSQACCIHLCGLVTIVPRSSCSPEHTILKGMQPQCLPCLPVELQDTQVQHSWPPPDACATATRVWLSSTRAGSLVASRSALLNAVLVQFSAMATSIKGSTLHSNSAESETQTHADVPNVGPQL